ncbi:MAG: hypothetical protein GWN58_13340, partial [Anaerolineae bacterium]|nr:hypothetical protein [Anaerolineae bacterium]
MSLRVRKRELAADTRAVIDQVLLNWVEVDYPPDGWDEASTIPSRDGTRRFPIDPNPRPPAWIRADLAPALRQVGEQADYLMVAPSAFLPAVEPLARFHRDRGLRVEITDVEAIYDAYGDGIATADAIRAYVADAAHGRPPPAPRYVLLVGDSSWDIHGDGYSRVDWLPSMQVRAHAEFAASDNGFVTVVGDDNRPDLAIGRLPARSAHELADVIDKIIRYAGISGSESWLRRSTWVTDASQNFQAISDALAQQAAAAGLQTWKVYPDPGADTARQDQQALIQAMDEGQLLVHFIGHGGRFVWRTGPTDYRNHSDLFSSADVESLTNAGRWPLVLSMTCSSGPFDHPHAGSIAESFLMAPGGGAIGVLAASWRVPASRSFSSLLIKELLLTGQSIGVAVMKAKQAEPSEELVESYNLLG